MKEPRERMRIAVIGAGVSGLGAAYALKDVHDVVLFERDARVGGHAHTVSIDYDGREIAVDTGFIVYNTRNYPNLVGLFEAMGVETQPSDMSFAFAGAGTEWSSNFPFGVFAQPSNLLRPSFLGMLADIRRFNVTAERDLNEGRLGELTLGGYLHLRGFSPAFETRYLLPMGAAIWSTSLAKLRDFPAESFIRFFANHGLLQVIQPLWRTVSRGSRSYVERMVAVLGERVRAGCGVANVRRTDDGVLVRLSNGEIEAFDQVAFACHSDQTLALLDDADGEERDFLGAVRYGPNRAWLHRDPRLMPRRRSAWGSWNYLFESETQLPPSVTYWMNKLQGIDHACPLFVSLNPSSPPDPALTFAGFDYDHPQFDTAALAAQRRFDRLQGRGGIWYAGAWLGYGFHEDGLTAGLRVAMAMGGRVPWSFVDHRIGGAPIAVQERRAPARRRVRA